jgi:hypothetical protein
MSFYLIFSPKSLLRNPRGSDQTEPLIFFIPEDFYQNMLQAELETELLFNSSHCLNFWE